MKNLLSGLLEVILRITMLLEKFYLTRIVFYGEEDSYYDKAIEILTQKINNVSISVQKGIEVASQIGDKSKLFKKSGH